MNRPYITDAVIYGSVVTGEPTPLSDIDLIFAVNRGAIKRARQIRLGLIVQAKKLSIPLDICLLTTDNRELEKPETASPSYLEMIDYAADQGGQIKGSVTGYFAIKRNEPWSDAFGYAYNRLDDLRKDDPGTFNHSKRPYTFLTRILNQPTHATRKVLQAMDLDVSRLCTPSDVLEISMHWLPELFDSLGKLQACRNLYLEQVLSLHAACKSGEGTKQTVEYNAFLEHLYRAYTPMLRDYLGAIEVYANQNRPPS